MGAGFHGGNELRAALNSYIYLPRLIKQSGWSDFNKNNFKPHFSNRGNQINFQIEVFRL